MKIDFTSLMNFLDSVTYAAAVTALVVLTSFSFGCLMAWVFGAL